MWQVDGVKVQAAIEEGDLEHDGELQLSPLEPLLRTSGSSVREVEESERVSPSHRV
jgi:hypothetical protein